MISSSVRKSLGCILLGCMVFLYGCGSSGAAGGTVNETAGTAAGVQNETQTVSGDGETEPENGDADGPSYSQNGRQFEILEVKEKYLLVSAVDTAYGLYTAGHGPVLEDEDGNAIQVSDLEPGMIVELTWNGMVQESYPGQFSYDRLRLTGRTGSRELLLYQQIIKELAKKDSGLNDGIGECYFDFTGVSSLTAAEKRGLPIWAEAVSVFSAHRRRQRNWQKPGFWIGRKELKTGSWLRSRRFLLRAIRLSVMPKSTEAVREPITCLI